MMVAAMPTRPTQLRPSPHHGYDSWTSTWYDADNRRRTKRFGKVSDVSRKIARAKYQEWLRTWSDKPRRPVPGDESVPGTVANLCHRYHAHARSVYRKGGRVTTHMTQVVAALNALIDAYGAAAPDDIGAPQVTRLRDAMIRGTNRHGADVVRSVSTVNGRLRVIKQMFAWARSYDLVSRETALDVALVRPLRSGRCEARPSAPVRPVPEDVLARTLEHAPPTVADMMRVQYWTGMRSGEICGMRPCDIDAGGDVWLYRPGTHKTEHHGKQRVVAIGPNAQTVLLPYLARRGLAEYVFQPADAHRERLEQIGFAAVTAYQLSRSRFKPGRAFSAGTYRNKVFYACDRAFDPTGERRAKRDYGHRWHPHRLRHNAATRLRETYGIEAATDAMGHSSFNTAAIYAERSIERLKDVARKVG